MRHAEAEQVMTEFQQLEALYVDLAPETVVEIGTHRGGTLRYWLKNASPGTEVVSVDLGPVEWVPPEPDFDNRFWWDWVPPDVLLFALTGDSHDPETVQRVQDIVGAIDWLFIDGDHSYEGVKQDWQLWSPLVADGGVVAFHDLKTPDWAPHIQVGKFWQELRTEGYLTEEFVDPDVDWGGIGVVYL